MMKTAPAVFAVGREYQIMVPVTQNSLFWVETGGKCFYDEQNGIMRSLCSTHRVKVPMSVLDAAGEYTVCERKIIDRKPYFPVIEDPVKTTFKFKPVPEKNARVYHIADTHNMIEDPLKAAALFGKTDLLIMNGDIPDHSGSIENYDTIYRLADAITGGSIPIVFARGNHDMRGYYAEAFAEHTPSQNGNTYYSFRVGSIWGLVLDCGEDKDDGNAEYGGTVSCHCFRQRQTDFIKKIIKNRQDEYRAKGVEHIIIVCHNPFTYIQEAPFDIEKEIYGEWAKLIKDNIKPELMLCGHIHELFVSKPGSERDHLGQPCTVISGSDKKENYHAGCGIVFSSPPVAKFYDSDGIIMPVEL
ncbi:MAG: metallophosphoesterase [Clostridia bacterium]|nr:metallophosphoesterase [Clostridia bacterium]